MVERTYKDAYEQLKNENYVMKYKLKKEEKKKSRM